MSSTAPTDGPERRPGTVVQTHPPQVGDPTAPPRLSGPAESVVPVTPELDDETRALLHRRLLIAAALSAVGGLALLTFGLLTGLVGNLDIADGSFVPNACLFAISVVTCAALVGCPSLRRLR